MATTSRNTKRTVKLRYVVTAICGIAMISLVWYGFALNFTLPSMTESNTEEYSRSTLKVEEKIESMHSMIDELQKEAKDSKAAISKLGSNMEEIQSQLTVLNSLLAKQQAVVNSESDPNSKEKKTPKDILQSVVKNIEGDGWKIATFNDNEPNKHNFECEMVPFGATGHKICVHRFDDVISNVIRREGNWGDCNILSRFWKLEVASTAVDPVYVEVGANIGSCIMEMLFNTDATIVAFEPNPKNLYPLKKTLSRLPQLYQERVALFPIALGSMQSSSTIYSASNNMGNSHVGKAVADLDMGRQVFHTKDTFEIKVERLDSILETGSNIPLMKLDAQGFECEILEGMGRDLASTVDHVHFEKSDRFLNAHGCNDLLARFRNLGFTIYNEKNQIIGPEKDCQNLAYDLEARRMKTVVI